MCFTSRPRACRRQDVACSTPACKVEGANWHALGLTWPQPFVGIHALRRGVWTNRSLPPSSYGLHLFLELKMGLDAQRVGLAAEITFVSRPPPPNCLVHPLVLSGLW